MSDFKENLIRLGENLDRNMRKNFFRSLPFTEELFDRWDRAKRLDFGENSSVHQSCYIYGDVKVGRDVWIGPFTILDGSGVLIIGDNCSISAGVQIYTHDTVAKRISGGKKSDVIRASTEIGSHCYIGPRATIAKGVKLGNHCIVGAHCLVTKSAPDFSVIHGTPGKIVGEVVLQESGDHYIEYLE